MSRGHVLVIEDHPDNQQLISWLLEDEDWAYTCADTGEEGLSLAGETCFDAILTDISLPGIDGKDVIRELRTQDNYAARPIIALTAHAGAQEQHEIIASGANEVLTKPIDEEVLISILNNIGEAH